MLTRYNAGFNSLRIEEAGVKHVCDIDSLIELRGTIASVVTEEPILDYIAKLVRKTRENRALVLGASPRASIWLLLGSKAQAALSGRGFVIPDDVKTLAAPVLRHRLILRPEAEIEGVTPDRIVESTLSEVAVPRS